ncbi:terminase gpP N-terminus-related DNA-binding protein [Bacillus sp. D-CC]
MLQGFSIKDITNMIGRSEKTIYNYVNAYKDKGLFDNVHTFVLF